MSGQNTGQISSLEQEILVLERLIATIDQTLSTLTETEAQPIFLERRRLSDEVLRRLHQIAILSHFWGSDRARRFWDIAQNLGDLGHDENTRSANQ
jgi:hypothetical protein